MHTSVIAAACALIRIGSNATYAQSQPDNASSHGAGAETKAFPPAGPQTTRKDLTVEQERAAWTLEAASVSKRLGLDEKQAAEVLKAYTESRSRYTAALESLRKQLPDVHDVAAGAGGGGNVRTTRAVLETKKFERQKLDSALAPILSPEQSMRAIKALGLFSGQWDQMVHEIAGLKLVASDQQLALESVHDYILSIDAANALNRDPNATPGATRSAVHDAEQKLADSLKAILTAEQLSSLTFLKFRTHTGGSTGGGEIPRKPTSNSGT